MLSGHVAFGEKQLEKTTKWIRLGAVCGEQETNFLLPVLFGKKNKQAK